ncbi:MAG: ABC transporter substrate-binding protein [Vallitalea sp.]|jgi:spermidine/putrescine transport system substrate-binding protein|nr:ABC transporter substrate-binding protein [Vallitalea sp.]MCT4688531.1 ABC transporter substrate-binding protein [Vallitalea sp.]
MKRIISLILVFITAISLFTACKKDDTVTLNIYNWGDYIDESIFKTFTDETGIKISYNLFDSNEGMYAKLKSGGTAYDVLIPSDYMIQKLIEEDILLKIDFDNVPNYEYIDDKFKNLAYDSTNEYSIPYMWGTVGILYNKDMVDETVDSWDILWNEKYNQSIVMQDSVRDAFAVALKKLNYSLNSISETELEEAKQLLIKQKPLVNGYVNDQVKDKMVGNEAALAVIYSGDAIVTSKLNESLKYIIPKEGSNLWFDAMCIPKTSKHKKEAEMFLNFLCREDIALANVNYIGYSTPHVGAKKLLPKELLNNKASYPPEEVLKRCEVFIDLGPTITKMYNDKWTEVKSK